MVADPIVRLIDLLYIFYSTPLLLNPETLSISCSRLVRGSLASYRSIFRVIPPFRCCLDSVPPIWSSWSPTNVGSGCRSPGMVDHGRLASLYSPPARIQISVIRLYYLNVMDLLYRTLSGFQVCWRHTENAQWINITSTLLCCSSYHYLAQYSSRMQTFRFDICASCLYALLRRRLEAPGLYTCSDVFDMIFFIKLMYTF